ncbi:hypothetical protein [Actinoplanes sp. NPDC051851]|uniref:hypothetical protein n=1 Tax=Actinoplanes sp. NPDC051851 TaxID=3154753 RepID=UPI00341CA95F
MDLPSTDRDLSFSAVFGVYWQGEPGRYWPARNEVDKRVVELAGRYTVAQVGFLESELNNRLGQWFHLAGIRLVAGGATLSVAPEVLAAHAEMQAIRRNAAVGRLRWETELDELGYLREKVFSRPEVARSYWLNRHLDTPGDVARIDFEAIAAMFAGPGESTTTVIAGLLHEFLSGLDDGQRRYLVQQLGAVFTAHARADLAGLLGSVPGEQAGPQ